MYKISADEVGRLKICDLTIENSTIYSIKENVNSVTPVGCGTDNALIIGSGEHPTTLSVNSNFRTLEGFGALLPVEKYRNCPQIRIHSCRDSIDAPNSLMKGDVVTHFMALGFNGAAYETVAGFRIDVEGEVKDGKIPGILSIQVGNFYTDLENLKSFDFDYQGNLKIPNLLTCEQLIAGNLFVAPKLAVLPVDAVAGSIIFDTNDKQFKGFNGTDWVCLTS